MSLYTTWANEAKHQYAKFIARRTSNFTNLAWTVTSKHALDRATTLCEDCYATKDLFPNSIVDSRPTILATLADKEEIQDYTWRSQCELKAKPEILYRIKGRRGEWLQIKSFYKSSDDQIYCCWDKYT